MTRQTNSFVPRADADVFGDVRRALDQRVTVPPEVHAHVDRGKVTLTGSVQWPSQRSEAEDAIRHIDGVQRVVNEIVVTRTPSREGFEAPSS